jgi:hypothetical protein
MLGENVCTKLSCGVAGQSNNREVSFSSKEISLMFGLCTKSKDHECGSGAMQRLRVASLMKQGALAGSINFLRTFGQFVGSTSAGENLLLENSTGNEDNIRKIGNINNKSIVKSLYFQGEPQVLGVTTSENRRHIKHDNSVGFRGRNAILRNGVGNAVGSNQNQEAPFHGSPLTLFCSIPSYIIPWELLLEDCCVVRAFGLSSLLVQILDPICDGNQQQANENKQTLASQNLGSSGLVQKHAFKGHLGPRLVRMVVDNFN